MMAPRLERHQVWLYLVAFGAGIVAGTRWPERVSQADVLIWPLLGALLYVTFTQVSLARLPDAFRHRRFLAANLVGNFVVIPLIVLGLIQLLPDAPAVVLGVLLVLLVPCTDWFNTFAQMGRGDGALAVTATPVNLVAQLALLPGYLWLFVGDDFVDILEPGRVVLAFLGLVLVPLALALFTQWRTGEGVGRGWQKRLAWTPVPLLAVVISLIAASQADEVLAGGRDVLLPAAAVFSLYLLAAPAVGIILARAFRLDAPAARTLVFSLGTRNSFVVLPIAIALPASWEAAALVIVAQSLIELLGMIAYIRAVPTWLIPTQGEPGAMRE